MYFIVVKFQVKPEHVDGFMDRVRDYTQSTRAEEGNLWFEWSRSVEDPNEFVLVEAFEDDSAGPHVQSEHFARVTREWPQYLTATPRIISRQVDGDGWEEMGEIRVE